jgi:hypothetical protein
METLAPGPARAASTVRVNSAPLSFKTSHYCSLGRSVFPCKSWRCSRCRRRRLAQDFARLRTALCRHVLPTFYLVLSLPASAGLSWSSWRRAAHCLERLLRRAVRRFGRLGYIVVWEQAGVRPHCNLILYSSALTPQGLHRLLRRAVVRSGFAPNRYCEPVERKRALIAYLCKHEQLPLSAPPGWQRVRASRGCLPARHDRRPRSRPRALAHQH